MQLVELQKKVMAMARCWVVRPSASLRLVDVLFQVHFDLGTDCPLKHLVSSLTERINMTKGWSEDIL